MKIDKDFVNVCEDAIRLAKKIADKSELDEGSVYKEIAFQEILKLLLTSNNPVTSESSELIEPKVECVNNKNKKSIEEFYQELKPSTHMDRVIAFAYYFYKHGTTNIFNAKDIADCYSQALVSKPSNISDLINLHRKKGRIMNVDEQKEGRMAFAITQDGIKYVENGFKEE